MNVCPHCNKPGVSTWEARWSARASPATCSLCRRLSHVIASMSSGITVMTALLLVATVLAAGIAGSWLLGGLGCLLTVGYNLWAWQRIELFPIFDENVTAARQVTWLLVVVSILLKFLQ